MSLRIAAALSALVAGSFPIYLYRLYQQLEVSFDRQDQFIPTRIYSDAARLSAPQPRAAVEERLTRLGYSPTHQDTSLVLKFHSLNYPTYLLPEDHATLTAGEKEVTLLFDGSEKNALLSSIQVAGQEVPELYLEPELIATLSRTGGDAPNKEIREYLKFSEIPAPIWKAFIAVEDPRFLEHGGFDPRGLARAVWVDLKTLSRAQGGSTITQQLVKNLMDRHSKSFFLKANEFLLAILLEVKYSKEQILERYLNEVYLGQVGNLEIHGISEGAKYFFGKRVADLNLAEAAMLAGVNRGVGFYNPYKHLDRAVEREKFVLKKMLDAGYIADGEAQAAASSPLRLAPPQISLSRAPFFTDYVKAELIRQLKGKVAEADIPAAGLRVYTTLDPQLNSSAQRAVASGIVDLEKKMGIPAKVRIEGALAAVDQSSGYIRALIGGRSYAQSNFNRILNMKRQVGSTFKPFVYLAAIDKGADAAGVPYGPGHPEEDGPWKLNYDHGHQTWSPRNYENGYRGWISSREALAHSINTVAARLGIEVGLPKIIETARALGIESDLPSVPSLSLGVAELSPIELLRAYATLANHGSRDDLTVIRGIANNDGSDYARFIYHPKQLYPAGSVDLLTDMLQNVFVDGTAAGAIKLGFDRPAAGKTGTTSQYRDAWFAGYTPQLTAVVWVGADQDHAVSAGKLKFTGANSALPIWVSFMKEALAGEPPAVFPISPSLTASRIDRRTGKLASSGCPDDQVTVEKYVIGHEPKDSSCEARWPVSVPQTDL